MLLFTCLYVLHQNIKHLRSAPRGSMDTTSNSSNLLKINKSAYNSVSKSATKEFLSVADDNTQPCLLHLQRKQISRLEEVRQNELLISVQSTPVSYSHKLILKYLNAIKTPQHFSFA